MALMSDVPNGLFDTAIHVKPPLEGAAVGVADCVVVADCVGVGVEVDAGAGVVDVGAGVAACVGVVVALPRLHPVKDSATKENARIRNSKLFFIILRLLYIVIIIILSIFNLIINLIPSVPLRDLPSVELRGEILPFVWFVVLFFIANYYLPH